MKFEINVEKKYMYIIIALSVVLAGLVFVVAYNTNNPQVLGHTPGEIGPGTFAGGGAYEFPGNSPVKISYLYPGLGTGDNYKYIRFGLDNDNKWAGFMWNDNDPSFGDGNDFVIFTYDDRDIVLKPAGTGKINLKGNSDVNGDIRIGASTKSKLNTVTDGLVIDATNDEDTDLWLYEDTLYVKNLQHPAGTGGVLTIGKSGETTSFESNVGIGTSTPEAKLDVNGNLRVKGSITTGLGEIAIGTDGWTGAGKDANLRWIIVDANTIRYNGNGGAEGNCIDKTITGLTPGKRYIFKVRIQPTNLGSSDKPTEYLYLKINGEKSPVRLYDLAQPGYYEMSSKISTNAGLLFISAKSTTD